MSTAPVDQRLVVAIDGQASSELAAALRGWDLKERPMGTLTGALELDNGGAAAGPPRLLRLGAAVGLEGLGAPFDGRFRLQQVSLRDGASRGLHVGLRGRR